MIVKTRDIRRCMNLFSVTDGPTDSIHCIVKYNSKKTSAYQISGPCSAYRSVENQMPDGGGVDDAPSQTC